MNAVAPRKRQTTRRAFDTVRRSTCGNCPVGCGVKGFIKDGELVDLFGDEEHPANKGSFCPKGLLSWILLNHPDRILRPRLREQTDQPFRDVSWDQALAFIAERLKTLIKDNGADSVIVHADATSPFGHQFAGTRFARALGTRNGPERFGLRAFGQAGRLAKMFGLAADRLLTNSQRDWANSRCILVVGSDPGATDPITLGPLVDVRDRGGSVVVIDSKTTITAVKASYFVRVNPGTEKVFLAGICRELIADKRIDENFIRETAAGFDAFSEAIAGFTIDAVMHVCGVSEADIKTVAKVVGSAHPVQAICGDWLTRHWLDDELLGLCAAIVCLRGSIGIPGGGLNVLDATPFVMTGEKPVAIEQLILAADPVSAVFFHGNPVAGMAGGAALQQRLSGVPLVVQFAGFNDETGAHAHVQLPLTTWLEEAGLLDRGNGRALQWRDDIVKPRGESRPVLDVWAALAAACGLKLPDVGDDRGAALARAAADSALQNEPLTAGISVASLDPDRTPPGGVLWPCPAPEDIAFEDDRFNRGDVRGPNILFRRNSKFPGSQGRFANGIDKIDLSQAAPSRGEMSVDDVRQRNGRTLKMIATVAVDYIAGWSGGAPTPSRAPTPPVIRIHPRAASDRGLRSGDAVVVANANGEFSGRVELSLTVAPDVVWCIATPGFTGRQIGPFALFGVATDGGAQAAYADVTVARGDARASGTPAPSL